MKRSCTVTMPEASGFAVVRGRFWRWDVINGIPVFINRDGSDRKRTPGPKHPVWEAYSRWEKWNKEQKGTK